MQHNEQLTGVQSSVVAMKPAYVAPTLTPLGSVNDFVLTGGSGDNDEATGFSGS